MSRKTDLPVLEEIFEPPPEIPKAEAHRRLSKFTSARAMRTIRKTIEQFGGRGKKLAKTLGPETLTTKRGRKKFFALIPFFH